MFSANEIDIDIAWFSPQSEYRPTEYLQRWVSFWFDNEKRLEAARIFQRVRLDYLRLQWQSKRSFDKMGFKVETHTLSNLIEHSLLRIEQARNHEELLTEEARLTKHLFRLAATATRYGNFTRAKRGSGSDPANRFLDHGNYLAYGLGATATWVLGLPMV